ncbi:MAG: glycosyltransferase [Bdellovibrionota bacterium]|nr:glycosyltransferase [Bdellovibrionota bacterium]
MIEPFINVIIPTFNRSQELKRALKSVFAQDYPHFDVWVIDDGSTDNTPQVIEEFSTQKNLNYIKTENRGVSAARNTGILKSKGEWCAFLDSDDEWLPHKLSRQVEFIRKNPTIPLVHGEEIWIRNGKRVNQKKIHQKSGGYIFRRCLQLCLISPSAVIIKRDVLQKLEGFDEEFTVCEDYDLWLKMTSIYEVGFIKDPLIYKYGGHEDQLSRKFKAMDYWRVKAIDHILEKGQLNKDDKSAAIEELKKKAEILLMGYKKHNNLENYKEVSDLYEKEWP